MVESTRGRFCTRKGRFARGVGEGTMGAKRELRKKVSGEGCSASECKSTQETDPLEKERTWVHQKG